MSANNTPAPAQDAVHCICPPNDNDGPLCHKDCPVHGLSKLRAEGVQAGEPFDAEVLAERLRDVAASHYETAMGFGISRDNFERCATDAAKIARDMASAPVADQAVGNGRNMFYEGLFDGETERQRDARLRWANDMRAAFERHTGNGWFDKDWHRETGIWAAAWKAATADSAPVADERVAINEWPDLDVVNRIVRSVCETEPANPDRPDSVCINVDELRAIIEAHVTASAPVAGEAQPTAYLTLDEEGSPCMLFFDVVEARTYCAPDEEPEPLFRHTAPQASEAWLNLAATVYQACGAYNMPAKVLDLLSTAASGDKFDHLIDGILPIEGPADKDAEILLWTFYQLGNVRCLDDNSIVIDHLNMSALEDATDRLEKAGFVEDVGYSAKLTDAGKKILDL